MQKYKTLSDSMWLKFTKLISRDAVCEINHYTDGIVCINRTITRIKATEKQAKAHKLLCYNIAAINGQTVRVA